IAAQGLFRPWAASRRKSDMLKTRRHGLSPRSGTCGMQAGNLGGRSWRLLWSSLMPGGVAADAAGLEVIEPEGGTVQSLKASLCRSPALNRLHDAASGAG